MIKSAKTLFLNKVRFTGVRELGVQVLSFFFFFLVGGHNSTSNSPPCQQIDSACADF